MTRWEYHIVQADWFSGSLMVRSPQTGKLIPLDQALAPMGDDGWEAISLQHAPMVPTGGRLVILMKRPKES